MSRSGFSAMVIATTVLAAPIALGQPSTPENGDPRFSFHRAGEGYIRLDGKTGEVSNCLRRSAGWRCQALPDERTALEAEIARLQADNAALKKELLSRSLPLPNGIRPDPPAPSTAQPSETRHEPRFRRVTRQLNRIWRRFVDLVDRVQREIMRRT